MLPPAPWRHHRRRKPTISPRAAGLARGGRAEVGSRARRGTEPVRARGYWEQVWLRFRRDKVAIGGGVFIIFLFLVAFVGAPIAAHILGHGPERPRSRRRSTRTTRFPSGPLTHVSHAPYPGATGHFATTLFVLGGDSQLGRDEFLRLLYGAQVSLEVAIGATIVA